MHEFPDTISVGGCRNWDQLINKWSLIGQRRWVVALWATDPWWQSPWRVSQELCHWELELQGPWLKVQELFSKVSKRTAAIQCNPKLGRGNCDDCAREFMQALRHIQGGILSAASPMVALLQHCSQEREVNHKVVAHHVAAAPSHLRKVFSSV